MYVKPAYRWQGGGRDPMHDAIAAALSKPRVQVLTLTLTEGNDATLRLYRSVGFSAWGTETLAVCTTAGLQGKVHMSLDLPRPGAAA
jgi:GNAT superfamily N-acetyltransferase